MIVRGSGGSPPPIDPPSAAVLDGAVRGLWVEGGTLRLRDDLPLPEPAPAEARVRVLCAGICGTDLALLDGYLPFAGVPGHEFVGRVDAAPGDATWVERRVVGEISVVCRRCGPCTRGDTPGRLGQLVARTLAPTGCEVRLVGRDSEPPPAREADVVVECSGHPDGLAAARRAVRPRGTIVLKSTYAAAVPLDISSIVVDEVTLVGSRCGPFARALELLSDGRVDLRGLVQARYPLSDAVAAFERAARPGVLKVLIQP